MGPPAPASTLIHPCICKVFAKFSNFNRSSCASLRVCVCSGKRLLFAAVRRSCFVVTRNAHVGTDKHTLHLRKYVTYVRHERECSYTCISM